MVKVRGLDKAITDLARGLGARTYVVRQVVQSGEHGSASENQEIWSRHAREGRDPFVYNEKDTSRVVEPEYRRFLDGRSRSLRRAAVELGKEAQRSVGRNIDSGRGIKPLSRGYAAWKRKHFPGRPILELTGELRRSLKVRIEEK